MQSIFRATDSQLQQSVQQFAQSVIPNYTSCMFILVINQLDAQNLFYSKFIACVYMFRALLCPSSGGQKLYYTASGIITPVGGRPVSTCARDDHLQV